MENNKQSLLKYTSVEASKRSFYLGSALVKFRSFHQIDDKGLADYLGCDLERVPLLFLCKRPNQESMTFQADIKQISATFNIKPVKLLQILREVDTLKSWAETSRENTLAPIGLLAAARDVNGPTEEQQDPEPGDVKNNEPTDAS